MTVVNQRPFAHHQSRLPPLPEHLPVFCHFGGQFLLRGGFVQDEVWNVQHTQQGQGDLPLEYVLGLVVHPRLPPPAHDKQAGDAIHLVVEQRRRRVYDIPQAAVLQVHHRHLARGQVVARRKAHGVSLVGGNDVVGRVQAVPVHQKTAQGLQL